MLKEVIERQGEEFQMRWFKAAGGLLAIVLVLASCIKVEGTIKIEDDGSGSVDFLTALNPDSLTSIFGDFDLPESELGDTDEICSEFASDVGDPGEIPAGGIVTPYNEDGFCGTRVQYPLSAATDHSANVSDLFDDTTRLYKEGDNWFFETDFDVDEITSEADGAPQAMMDALFGEASFRISVDLPGRAIAGENNATDVGDDGKFTWDIDILNPPARLFAQTEPGSGGGTGGGGDGLNPLVIVAIVAVLAALVAGFFFMKKKQQTPDTATGIGTDFPAPGADPSMPLGVTGQGAGLDDRATMPLSDSPPIAAAPPVLPTSDAARETVVMSSQDAIDAAKATVAGDSAAAAADTNLDAAADTAASSEPVYDEALAAWVIDDPTRGRLRHDPASDTWNPV